MKTRKAFRLDLYTLKDIPVCQSTLFRASKRMPNRYLNWCTKRRKCLKKRENVRDWEHLSYALQFQAHFCGIFTFFCVPNAHNVRYIRLNTISHSHRPFDRHFPQRCGSWITDYLSWGRAGHTLFQRSTSRVGKRRVAPGKWRGVKGGSSFLHISYILRFKSRRSKNHHYLPVRL